MTQSCRHVLVSTIPTILLAACQTPPRATESAAPAVIAMDTTRVKYSPADARFMHGMIAHHNQALAMTGLARTRSQRDDLRLLAQRIEVSQRDEIGQMQRWLRDHHAEVQRADPSHVHHAASGHDVMPGMLTEAEMSRLSSASGVEFDRLFLEYMIRHHEGALAMVKQLFGTNGAAQAPEVYQLATDVDSDQRAEISRMRALLAALPSQ
jgi:uncharacterized protein (DUF305 family)